MYSKTYHYIGNPQLNLQLANNPLRSERLYLSKNQGLFWGHIYRCPIKFFAPYLAQKWHKIKQISAHIQDRAPGLGHLANQFM